MRACSNNNIFYYGVTHVSIVACPHPCLAAYILHLFSTFWYCHPYILQHMEMFLIPCIHSTTLLCDEHGLVTDITVH